jgi:adenylate kinase family enzyme
VALLAFDEPLSARPWRVLVAGTSGSGKTTIAGRVAESLGIPHIEIDALYHGPNWTPRETFEADVRSFSSQPAWATEWQYSQVRPLLAARADLVVWLDLPRRTVMRQVIRRTLHRRLLRQRLWNGNVEPPLWSVLHDDTHIVRWAWNTHHKTETRMRELSRLRPDLPIVRLRSRGEAMHWLTVTLAAAATDT